MRNHENVLQFRYICRRHEFVFILKCAVFCFKANVSSILYTNLRTVLYASAIERQKDLNGITITYE